MYSENGLATLSLVKLETKKIKEGWNKQRNSFKNINKREQGTFGMFLRLVSAAQLTVDRH